MILVAQLLPRVGAHDAAAKAPAAPADEASSGLGSSHATDTVEVAGR